MFHSLEIQPVLVLIPWFVSQLSSLSSGKRSEFSALHRLKEFKSTLLVRVPEPLRPTGHPQLPPLTLDLMVVESVRHGQR